MGPALHESRGPMNDTNESRRRWLRAIALFGAGDFALLVSRALAKGDMPLAPGIHHLEGTARVNGRDAKVGAPVTTGDKISTGGKSQAVIVLCGDTFLPRSRT